jgi:DNA mismatch repair protein MutL
VLSPEDLQSGSWLPPDPQVPTDPFAVPNAGATPPTSTADSGTAQPTLTGLAALTPETRPIAQLWNAYIIAEGPGGLLIIDQHLAHERILYERLLGAGEAQPTARSLANPATLQLSHGEALRIDAMLAQLANVGFALEPFGRDAFVLRAVPECLQPGSELSTLREVINELIGRSESEASAAGAVERVAAATACRAAVKKGSRLGFEELKRLLQDLAKTTNSAYCPHNCPISVELSYADLLRKFKRT